MSKAGTDTLKAQQANGNIRSDSQRIREYLEFKDGMTSKDLSDTLGIDWSTFCARLSKLVDKGVVYYDGTETFFDQTHSVLKYEQSEPRQKIRAEKVKRGKFLKVLKRMRKDYSCFMSNGMKSEIDLELEK